MKIKRTKIYKIFLSCLLIVMAMMIMSGCESKKDKLKEGEIYLYYTDKNRTELKSVIYKPKEDETIKIVGEVLEEMNTTSKELNVVTAKPEEVMILDYELTDNLLEIDFDNDYLEMGKVKELLCRSAIVLTVTQIEGVEFVMFTINGEPLTNSDNNVIGLSLVPFDPILSCRCSSNMYFPSMQKDKKLRFFKIGNGDIVTLRLSDVGFWRYHFRLYYHQLLHLDMLKVSDMSLDPQKTGFDFTAWKDKREFQLLKRLRKIGWYGRNTNNQYMGEAYLLYRTIRLRSLRKKFLDYFLEQINASLTRVCSELKIEGELFAKSTSYDYDDLFQKLQLGEINYSQLGKYIFPRIQ